MPFSLIPLRQFWCSWQCAHCISVACRIGYFQSVYRFWSSSKLVGNNVKFAPWKMVHRWNISVDSWLSSSVCVVWKMPVILCRMVWSINAGSWQFELCQFINCCLSKIFGHCVRRCAVLCHNSVCCSQLCMHYKLMFNSKKNSNISFQVFVGTSCGICPMLGDIILCCWK